MTSRDREISLRQWLLGLVLLALALGVSSTAHAQEATPVAPVSPVTDNQVNAVAKRLYCPVCENVPLDVCPTVACAQWRATIREKLAAGWSDQQILDYFAAQYGERVLAQPSTRGLNVLVWVIPPLLLLAGAFGLWRFLRGQARPAAQPPAPAPPPADEYTARLERELRERQ
jgi:cytochrome c-type biogenesis protein CcmH